MNKTKIEWCRNPDGSAGWSWNPLTGCLNHINGMCKGGNFPCFAYRLATTRLRDRYLANRILPALCGCGDYHYDTEIDAHLKDPFYPRLWPERLNDVLDSKKEKGIFVCDMSDLFGIGIPEDWTRQVLNEIRFNERRYVKPHRFYLLTKQPQNLAKWSPFPDNCWVGVTATNAKDCLGGLRGLEAITAKVKYISFEPLLDYIGGLWLADWLNSGIVNWLIIGAQTKPYKPPEIEHVKEIVEAADKAGIPVFLKKNIEPLLRQELNNKYLTGSTPNLLFHKWGVNKHGIETQILRQELP
ncbi:hypothetical protein LCGC14_1438730 [marine sediment metagenome]|uniref:DUF5131 family protein n=1 Tax=marine sediment metagenome TaxID=412755 RepID=A0A0F9JLW9_9ZZZZ